MLCFSISNTLRVDKEEALRNGTGQKKIPDLRPGLSIKNNFYQLWLIVYASDFSDLLLFSEFFKVKISF